MKSVTLDGRAVTIEKQLGGGRYAEVFAGRLGSDQVVVKIARREPLGPDAASATGAFAQAEALERHTGSFGAARVDPSALVNAEADLLGKLNDPLFAKVIGRGTEQKRAFFVMERVMGRTFRESAGAAKPTTTHFATLAAELDRLRTTGKLPLHGDLKPDNLLLDLKGRVRALDPSAHGWIVEKQQVKAMLMTPLYNPWADPSDVPALALTMCETFYGVQPLLHADDALPPLRMTSQLERVVSLARATGRAPALGRLLAAPALVEMAPKMSKSAEEAIYKALHLRKDPGGGFDWDDGFTSCAALVAAFGAPR